MADKMSTMDEIRSEVLRMKAYYALMPEKYTRLLDVMMNGLNYWDGIKNDNVRYLNQISAMTRELNESQVEGDDLAYRLNKEKGETTRLKAQLEIANKAGAHVLAASARDHHWNDRDRPVRTAARTREFINSGHPCCIPTGDACELLERISVLEKGIEDTEREFATQSGEVARLRKQNEVGSAMYEKLSQQYDRDAKHSWQKERADSWERIAHERAADVKSLARERDKVSKGFLISVKVLREIEVALEKGKEEALDDAV